MVIKTDEQLNRLQKDLSNTTFVHIDQTADFVGVPEGFPKNLAEWKRRDKLKGTKFTYKSKYGGELHLVADYVLMQHTTGEILEETRKEVSSTFFGKTVDALPGPVAITFYTAERNYYSMNEVTNYELPDA